MIKNSLEWRRSYKPHLITAEDVKIELNNTGKMYRNGFDKHGRPIIYMKPGKDNTGKHLQPSICSTNSYYRSSRERSEGEISGLPHGEGV
jgi:hypothetical protein